MIGVRIQDPLGFQVENESEVGKVKLGTQQGHFPRPSNQVASLGPVTPVDGGGSNSSGSSGAGSGTWGRSGPPKKEELVGGKKKGRTWGPSSTLQKERAEGEERYWWLEPTPCPTPRPMATRRPTTTPSLVPPAG